MNMDRVSASSRGMLLRQTSSRGIDSFARHGPILAVVSRLGRPWGFTTFDAVIAPLELRPKIFRSGVYVVDTVDRVHAEAFVVT